jgi:hypothetical protein
MPTDHTTRRPGYWISDLEALNRVYQAVKRFEVQQDTFSRDRMFLEAKKAENSPVIEKGEGRWTKN